jgi:3-methyladenine DNA glycosylase AlkD
MNLQEALDTLRSLGTESARKTYRRHGAAEDVYGVSYAELGKLKKKIKVDHALAEGLWASGNHDARMLAAMIADPARLDRKTLDAWAAGLRNYVETDALGTLAASAPHAREVMTHWMAADGEWVAAAGWHVLSCVARQDDGVPDDYYERYLATIERDIAESPNRVRHKMNGALISIGLRNPALEAKALAAAARIGKVEVDHGDTDCKTPDAPQYILKAKARERKKR